MVSENQISDIFCLVDDFFKQIPQPQKLAVVNGKKTRVKSFTMSDSEVATIVIAFHLSGVRCFKWFYLNYVMTHLQSSFPNAVSYNRFTELSQKSVIPMLLFLNAVKGLCTGISFVDSTAIKSCRNQRINSHKTMKGYANRGKTSMGWFYGFKLHFAINENGEVLSFKLTKGNVHDGNRDVVKFVVKNLFGKLFADKGYISKELFEMLHQDGLLLFTKIKKNMKNSLMSIPDKVYLRKRAVIESVIDFLKNICQVEHTRHRSINNFLSNLVGALIAYSFIPKKPSIGLQFENVKQLTIGM